MNNSTVQFFKRQLYRDFQSFRLEITRPLLLQLLAANAAHKTRTCKYLNAAIREIWFETFHTEIIGNTTTSEDKQNV